MPFNNFSVGKDVTINLVGYDGTIQSFPLQLSFDAKQETKDISIHAMNGTPYFLDLPAGWTGSFSYDRQGPLIDAYFARLEAAYYNGTPIQACSITETIQEPSGAISQFQYTGVVMKLSDAGSWKGDSQVTVKVDWKASFRVQKS